MSLPSYPYDPREVYQWSNGDADEFRGAEGGFLGPGMTTGAQSRPNGPRVQPLRFNDNVVSIGRPFSAQSVISTPEDFAYQPDQRNIDTNSPNAYEAYGYTRFDPILAVPPSAAASQVPYMPHHQPVSPGVEYERSGSLPPGEYRDYLTPSRSTAKQQPRNQLSITGPIRTWRLRAQPHHYKADPAEIARVYAPLSLSTEERKRALRAQFDAQFGASRNSPNQSTPEASVWRETKSEHTTPSMMSYAVSSSSSSEHLSLSHVPPTPSTSSDTLTVFIHSNLTQTATPATNPAHDYPELFHFFPLQTEPHRQLRVAMHAILNSEWKLRNELEPTSQDILQFSTRILCDGSVEGEEAGTVKYRCLLYHQGEECKGRWARAERMLAHLRGAIDLRPFACEGERDACNCNMRFFAEDTLQQHRKNAKAVECPECKAGVTPRNLKRHLRNNCPKSSQRSHD